MTLRRLITRMILRQSLPPRAGDGRFVSAERARVLAKARALRVAAGLPADPRFGGVVCAANRNVE